MKGNQAIKEAIALHPKNILILNAQVKSSPYF
jgi:hypothetical protein